MRLGANDSLVSLLQPQAVESLSVSITQSDDIAVATVEGEIDLLTARLLSRRLAEYGNVRHLVIDLDRVRFLGCSGLTVLLDTRDDAEREGVTLSLVASDRSVRRPLEVTELNHVFDIYGELSQALAAVPLARCGRKQQRPGQGPGP